MLHFRVSAETDVACLAGAIACEIRKGEETELSAIGAGALNQSVKGIARAKEHLEKEGIYIAATPWFANIVLDGEEKTAIKLHVFQVYAEEQSLAS